MKRFLFLLIIFSFSMSAQAAKHNTCKAAHKAAVQECAGSDARGQELAACLNDARAMMHSAECGYDGSTGGDDGSTGGDDGSGGGDDGSGGGDDGSGGGTPPGPSACESGCQSSYDDTAQSCESDFACEGLLCDFLDLAKQACLDSASATMNSCLLGCGG